MGEGLVEYVDVLKMRQKAKCVRLEMSVKKDGDLRGRVVATRQDCPPGGCEFACTDGGADLWTHFCCLLYAARGPLALACTGVDPLATLSKVDRLRMGVLSF